MQCQLEVFQPCPASVDLYLYWVLNLPCIEYVQCFCQYGQWIFVRFVLCENQMCFEKAFQITVFPDTER